LRFRKIRIFLSEGLDKGSEKSASDLPVGLIAAAVTCTDVSYVPIAWKAASQPTRARPEDILFVDLTSLM
jgi:hypothetical protein